MSSKFSHWLAARKVFLATLFLLLILPITILVLQDRQTVNQQAATPDPASGNPAPNGPTGEYHLVFSDEFNGTSLDLSKWIMCNPSFASSCLPYNEEQQKFNAIQTGNENVKVDGGQLHLIATKDASGQIWSGMVSTGPNKFNYVQPAYQPFLFTYGYYEGKVKFPKGNGFWPSMWMLPDQEANGAWPDSGEYDVVEIAGNDPTKGYFTSHWGPNGSGTCGHPCTPQEATIADASAGFHTYGFDWEEDGLTWYVDGKQIGEKITDPAAIRNTPFYIIANFSVGGTWPPLNGAPDASTPFPASMDIDYLRVWQKGASTGNPTTAPTTGPTATQVPLPTAVTPTLYCLGEDASEQCGTLSPTPTVGEGTVVPTGTDITTTPGEEVPSTEPITTTEPGEETTTPCPTTEEGIEESTESTVSVQHGGRHHHHHKGGWFRKFFRWLLEWLIELINKLLGGNGGITLPPVDPCATPTPTSAPIPTVEEATPTTGGGETITPTTGTTISPTTPAGVTPTTGAGGTKSQVILMPLGDSITDGGDSMGGYRLDLWKKLVQTDGDKIDFVGSLNGGPSDLGDKDHEGHIGWNITELDEQINGWMTTSKPDIVLLHIGTNDLDQGASASEMESNLKKLLTDIYTAKPDTALVVSSLIITTVGEKATWTAYNAAIPGIVSGFKSQGKNITYVDMSNSLTEADLDDGAHPTWEGYSKMATVWYPIVKSLYDSMIAK
jgi:beta-glucanase (GH16 family)/lysophospholipase L1-like esterase